MELSADAYQLYTTVLSCVFLKTIVAVLLTMSLFTLVSLFLFCVAVTRMLLFVGDVCFYYSITLFISCYFV